MKYFKVFIDFETYSKNKHTITQNVDIKSTKKIKIIEIQLRTLFAP